MEMLLLLWIFFVIVTGAVASSKGRSVFAWVVLAAIFSFFALIAVAVLPSLKAAPVRAGEEIATPETHVRCPDCKELVRADANVCKHCGCKLLPRPPAPSRAHSAGAKAGRIARELFGMNRN